jgi:transcriptional regulator with XRE-family HTH domain
MKSYYFRAARAILNESLDETSEKSGVSRSSINRIENAPFSKLFEESNAFAFKLLAYYKKRGIDLSIAGVILISDFEELNTQTEE